jgi:hypothetical protein
MFLRENIGPSFRKTGTIIDKEWKPISDLIKYIESFISRWVFLDKNKDYYRGLLLELCKEYDYTINTYTDKEDSPKPWILADESLRKKINNGKEIVPVTKEELLQYIQKIYIIIILGPTGYGKSGFAEQIVNNLKNDNKVVHFDGDKDHVLELPEEEATGCEITPIFYVPENSFDNYDEKKL